ncbi:MAG: hypothetical protein KKH88_04110 [Nanoarchaeota archaeon]|nr:hypothetical protein [Nanoarchaeota archaeon]MBU1444757.1 hypothetical protein [Nanoarchaeota archaeon]MBU2406685.1 hypothetical protein [Nanoarchaeota archaeon]MBU2420120.1 hypothetical protein [Nanoarchaeota archaeon]MBU2474886.1 hypothetical protein [Nanoarchaeota archaeon]
MKKGIIYGIGNNGKYSHFEFKKEKSILLRLVKLISLLDYVEGCNAGEYFVEYEEYDEKFQRDKRIKRKLSEFVDRRYNFSDKNFDIDIVFGKNRVFLIMCVDKEISKSVRKFIGENFEIIKAKKIKQGVMKKK